MDQSVANNEVKIMDSCESPDGIFKLNQIKILNSTGLPRSRIAESSYDNSPLQSKRNFKKPLDNSKIQLKLIKPEESMQIKARSRSTARSKIQNMLKQRNEEAKSEEPNLTFRGEQKEQPKMIIKPKFVNFNKDFKQSNQLLTESKDYVDTPVNMLDSSTAPLVGINSLNSRNNHNHISEHSYENY